MNNLELKLSIFNYSVLFVHIAYLAIFFGIIYVNERYIRNFSTFIQFGVCIFLITRFSPFNKTHEITKLDVYIIFYCATFLLMNVVAIEMYNIIASNTNIHKYFDNINNTIKIKI